MRGIVDAIGRFHPPIVGRSYIRNLYPTPAPDTIEDEAPERPGVSEKSEQGPYFPRLGGAVWHRSANDGVPS